MVYLAGYNGKVYSYSISKQSESSNAQLDQDDSKPIVGGPVVDQGKVYVASSNGNLYALDATTLAQIWKFQTGNKIWSTPAVDNGTVFVGSFDKKVYALDEATGNKKWSFNTQGAIIATPVIGNGTVYVASFDRHIYALDEATGSVKWQYPALGQSGNTPSEWFWATPVISNGILYAPCLDGKVYAVNTQDGSLVTTFDLGVAIYSLDVSAGAAQQLLIELRKEDTQPNLKVNSKLSIANGIVYIHGLLADKVYAFDPGTKDFTPSKIITGATSSASTTVTTTTIAPTTVIVTTTVTTTVTVTK
jgi:outer membrane protein assembly factor BamB